MKNLLIILVLFLGIMSCDTPQLMSESYEDVKGECLYHTSGLNLQARTEHAIKFSYVYNARQYSEVVLVQGSAPICVFNKGEFYNIPLKVSKYDTHTKVEVSKPHLVHRFNCRHE